MLRLFTGIALPPSLSRRLRLMQGGVPGATWVTPDNFHITLTFIGDVDEAQAEEADDALSTVRAPSFPLSLAGTGSFTRKHEPATLYLGVEKSEGLTRLHDRICHALDREGVPFERRKYTPHVTLARLKNADAQKLVSFMQEHDAFTAEPFTVDSFFLYRSHQTKTGAVYEVLREYPLS